MPFPKRMNPVNIKLHQRNAADTVMDSDFREPASTRAFDAGVVVKGQVNFGMKKYAEQDITMTGDKGDTMGWFCFRKSDLDRAGISLQKGDRVSEVAGEAMDLEIVEARPESPLRGRFLLIYADFEHVKEKRESV